MPKKYHPATDEMHERFRAAFDEHYASLEDEAMPEAPKVKRQRRAKVGA